MDLGPIGDDAEEQLGFRDELIADERRGVHPRQRRAAPAERHLQPQPIARHDLPAELGVVHAAQVDAGVGRRVIPLEQQNRRDLRQRLQHQDAGHQRRAGKVSLEEFLVHRDVLDRHEAVRARAR